MADEQVIKLLEEIRDLQKLHIENYKAAVKNQQEAIELQKSALGRQKTAIFAVLILVVAVLGLLVWASCAVRPGRLATRRGARCGPGSAASFGTPRCVSPSDPCQM